MRRLTERDERFVEAFMANGGNAKSAALAAGFSDTFARAGAYKLPARPHIRAAIEARRRKAEERAEVLAEAMGEPVAPHAVLMTRAERQGWWSQIVRGEIAGCTMEQRIKCSELLGRSQGDFIERKQVQVGVTLESILARSWTVATEATEEDQPQLPPPALTH